MLESFFLYIWYKEHTYLGFNPIYSGGAAFATYIIIVEYFIHKTVKNVVFLCILYTNAKVINVLLVNGYTTIDIWYTHDMNMKWKHFLRAFYLYNWYIPNIVYSYFCDCVLWLNFYLVLPVKSNDIVNHHDLQLNKYVKCSKFNQYGKQWCN